MLSKRLSKFGKNETELISNIGTYVSVEKEHNGELDKVQMGFLAILLKGKEKDIDKDVQKTGTRA
jgi:hypothetical protein